MKTVKTHEEAMKSLPAHLLVKVNAHAEKMKKFGIVDLSTIDRSKFDDFHPIHAML